MTSTTANARAIAYQYDAAGNRTRMTWPDTAFFVTTAYDALNRPTTIKEKDTAALASYAYDDLSRRTVITLGNGTTTSYGYNPQGDLSSLAHDLASTANDQSYTYTRNQAREIVTHSWSNDLYQWPVSGLVANGTKSYTANGRNQYTAAIGATITHDANGNMTGDGTWTYTYDENNRLKSANRASPALAINLGYDAEGRLRVVSPNAVPVARMYDGQDLVAEYNSSGTLVARYVHGPGVDEPLVTYTGTGAATKNWLYADHLGSIVASADSTGAKTDINKYGPFGEPHTLSGGTRFRYTGQQTLGFTGLMYYKARFYDPRLGRFLQTDPIGTADDMNLYAYVQNNPANRIDPTGLYVEASQVGNEVNLRYPVRFIGSGATPEATAAYSAAIQKAWTGGFGRYNVKMNVVPAAPGAPRARYNVIEIGPTDPKVAGGQPFANDVGGSCIKIAPLNSERTRDYRLWTAGHEAGHAMGLPDMYTKAGPMPMYGGNIMGEAGGRADELDIANILYLQSIGLDTGHGSYPSPTAGASCR